MSKKMARFINSIFGSYEKHQNLPEYRLAEEVFKLKEQIKVMQEIMILKDLKEKSNA